MGAEVPDRDARVELVAAALCEAEWSHPSVWEPADETRREVYRREAWRLLTRLDACADAHHADPVTEGDLRAGLDANLHADAETWHAGNDETWTARDEEMWTAFLATVVVLGWTAMHFVAPVRGTGKRAPVKSSHGISLVPRLP